MVSGAGSCAVLRRGPVTSGVTPKEAAWVATLAAGTADTLAAGTASDSAASPPTAATGIPILTLARMSADRPRDAARPGGDAAPGAGLLETKLFHSFGDASRPGMGEPADTRPMRGPGTGRPVFTPRTQTVIPHADTEVDRYPPIYRANGVWPCCVMSH